MTTEATYLHLLKELVAQPSLPAKQEALPETADLIAQALTALGASVTVDRTYFAPLVIGHIQAAKPTAKTILFYNHYDVQPAEPFAAWDTDPFTLTQKGDCLYGRGVNDDKGNFTARLNAVADYLATQPDGLAVNLTFLVEGAEESASQYLPDYLAAHPELKADLVIWESGSVDATGQVELVGGNKGILTFDLTATSGEHDLHSSLAAVVQGAPFDLAAAITALQTDYGQGDLLTQVKAAATVPSPKEKEMVAALPFDRTAFRQANGIQPQALLNESDQALKEALYLEPTLNVAGITAGYQGPGVKTVLPAVATAKAEIRLTPGLVPDQVLALIRQQLRNAGLAEKVQVRKTLGQPGYRSDLSAPAVTRLKEVISAVYGQAPKCYPSSAGTGPMATVAQALQAPIAAVGIGYFDNQDHAPNEHIRLADYRNHVRLIKALIGSYESK
ncbi:M20/M25/M40 family metallo-hydrolase [Leuconostocaceae bacterium ESL0958]|nr:M20/M25/M40 family metallo-hydrolase [Leuconostocaceae bacterium ESL0958]